VATEGTNGSNPDGGGKRLLLLRPDDWNPMVAAAIVFVLVVVVVGFVALLLLGYSASDKTAGTTSTVPQIILSPRLKQAERCFKAVNIPATTDGLDDFVAENALGGAIKAPLQGNVVTISDGLTPAGAIGIVHGYERLAQNLDLAHLLRRESRFALLWGNPPTASQTRTISACLR
jgi:hypothetical protein